MDVPLISAHSAVLHKLLEGCISRHRELVVSEVMEAVLLGLDEAVCIRQSLLWTLTSTALRRLRVHARNLPAPLHLLHTHRCVSRPLYQVGCTTRTHKTLTKCTCAYLFIQTGTLAEGIYCKVKPKFTSVKRCLMQGLHLQPPTVCPQAVPPVEMDVWYKKLL